MSLEITARRFDPADWYWVVGGSTTQVYSSAAIAYVSVSNPTYLAWLAVGNKPTKFSGSEQDLWDYLIAHGISTPSGTGGSQQQTATEFSSLPVAQRKLDFWLVNQVRQLNGQPALTLAQFLAAVNNLAVPS